ncbi:MAG: ArnT family glycosyltransferase [Vicinamibacteria bacterium]
MKFQRALAAIVSILTLACFLRLWGSDYGIPHSVARPDEETVVQNALQMFADRDPNPRFFEYPTLSMYATALGFETAYRVGKLDHRYDEPFDFLFDNAVLRPGLAYRIARAVSLVFALGTVAATGWLGWEVSRRENVALISALLLSANFLHVAFSRFATVDVAMTFFITLALAFSVRAAKYQKWRDYLASGLAIGLAASAKYNAALVALGLLAAAVYGFREHRRKGALQLLSAALASIAAFAATSPYALLHPDEVRAGLEKHSYFFTHGPDPLGLSVHLGRTFPAGLGWPLYLASLIALGWVVLRRRREDVVLLLFLLPFFATIAGVRVV